MSVELFKHNKETYQNIQRVFSTANRVGIVQPTGTGKSFIFLKWIEDNPQDKFIILSPSIEIFNQLEEYAESSGDKKLLENCEMITFQTLLYKSDNELIKLKADKIIIDEFHRTGAELWGVNVEKLLKNNVAAQVLGATATPVRYLDGGKNMAEELFDNRLARYMTLGEAVAKKILPEPVYVPVWYEQAGQLGKYQSDIEKIKDISLRKKLDERLKDLRKRLKSSYGASEIFKKYMPDNHGKYIVFCSDYEHLQDMKEKMSLWLAGFVDNIHFYTSISRETDRDEQLNQFKKDDSDNAIKLLFTIDRLNEGIHVKGIDGVIMLRPTISPIIYLQQMGRALASGRKTPIIFDMVNNYHNVQIFNEQTDSVNIFVNEFTDAFEDYQLEEADTGIYRMFERAIEFNKLFYSLENVLYIDNERKWQQTFEIFREYVKENDKFPSVNTSYKNVNIGEWLRFQNRSYNRGTLLAHRENLLRETGVELGQRNELVWNNYYNILQKYVQENNRLPKDRTEYNGYKIGKWLANQKKRYSDGTLPELRKQQLVETGVLFDNALDQRWQGTFELLTEYMNIHKKEPIKSTEYKGIKIGLWLRRQQTMYRAGKLQPDRQKMLQSLGIKMSDTHSKMWEQNYLLLMDYVYECGKLPLSSTIYKGVNLGTWYKYQKENMKKGTLSADRQQKLLDLNFHLSFSKKKNA